jgi:hypothetical protein
LRISRFVLAVAFAGLGIWALAKANYVTGAIYIVFSSAWLLMGVVSDRLAARRVRRCAGENDDAGGGT